MKKKILSDPPLRTEKAIYREGWGGESRESGMVRTMAQVLAAKQKEREARGDGGPGFLARQKNEAIKAALAKAKMSAPAGGSGTEVKKKPRYRPGTKTLMEIRKIQRTTTPCLRFAPFTRLVRERGKLVVEKTVRGKMMDGVRYKRVAMEMLREMVECWMIRIMEDAHLCCLHRKVKGVQVKDIRLAERIRFKPGSDWKREYLEAARDV